MQITSLAFRRVCGVDGYNKLLEGAREKLVGFGSAGVRTRLVDYYVVV